MGLFFWGGGQESAKNVVFGNSWDSSLGGSSRILYLGTRMWYVGKYKCVSFRYRKNQDQIYRQKYVRGPKGEHSLQKKNFGRFFIDWATYLRKYLQTWNKKKKVYRRLERRLESVLGPQTDYPSGYCRNDENPIIWKLSKQNHKNSIFFSHFFLNRE